MAGGRVNGAASFCARHPSDSINHHADFFRSLRPVHDARRIAAAPVFLVRAFAARDSRAMSVIPPNYRPVSVMNEATGRRVDVTSAVDTGIFSWALLPTLPPQAML
jgi:hypothetical protein